MMLAVILASVSAGVILTLLLQCLCLRKRFGSLPRQSIPSKPQTESFQLPKELQNLLNDPELKSKKETCIFLNLLFQFLFRELKDKKFVRRWVVRKMNAEFTELLQTTSGKLLEKISVRDFNFGSTFPIVHNATIRHSRMSEDQQSIEELDIALDIEYNGGFHLAVDADLVFGKSAYLSVRVTELKGCLRLQFSRNPYTHWSLAFYEDPTIEFNVESRFEGRPIPQITSLIVNQIRRSIKKKHTLPNYKMRYKPFFLPQEPFLKCQDLYFRGNRIGEGCLEITVIECSRLLKPPAESNLYCTVSLGSLPWFELVRVRRTFVTLDVQITRLPGQAIGLLFKEDFLLERYESVIVIEAVSADGPAAHTDIKKYDILVAVGNQKATSQKQAAKLLKNAGEKFTIRVERVSANKSSDTDVKFEEDFINVKDGDYMSRGINKKDREEDFVNISVKSVNGDTKSLQASPTSQQKRSSVASLLRRRTKSNVGENTVGESPQSSPEVRRRTTTTSSDTKDVLTRSPMTSPKKQSMSKTDRSLSNSDPQINTAGKRKLSGNRLEDQPGLDPELDSDPDSEEETDVRKTKLVSACQDPLWNEKFKFEVEEGHKYLNVCVRCKIPEKLERSEKQLKAEKDMLLGYASLSLSDIALDCLMTLQGDVQRTVHLSPEETKAGASRAKLPNLGSHPGFDPNLCYGDITLGFQHMPHKSSLEERKRLTKHPSAPSFTDTPHPQKSTPVHDVAHRSDEGLHSFVDTEFKMATYCNFCGKKIWLKTAFQCHSCDMICHKKCMEKCQTQTLCGKNGIMRRSQPDVLYKTPTQSIEADKKKAGEETVSRTSAILSKFRKDHASKRGKSPSNSPLIGRKVMAGGNQIKVESSPFYIRRRNSAPDDNESDGSPPSGGFLSVRHIPRTRSTTSLQNLVHQNAPPALTSEDFKNVDKLGESSGDEGEVTMSRTAVIEAICPSGVGHNVDEMVVTKAKKMGKELFSHLTLEERKGKLDAMVSKLQQEIDVESEHRAELGKAEQESYDSNRKRILQCQIGKADEKIQALIVLMLHYCAGLQHCMDMAEEKRQQVDGKMDNIQEATDTQTISDHFAQEDTSALFPTVEEPSDCDDLEKAADIESSGEFEISGSS